jgi:hypothetical protein
MRALQFPLVSGFLQKRNAVKIAAVAAGILFRAGSIKDAFDQQMLSFSFLAFLAISFTFIALIFATAFTRSNAARWFYAVAFAVMSMPVIAYEHAAAATMDYFQFITLVDARSAAGNALAMYGWSFVYAAAASLALLLGIGVAPSANAALRPKWVAILPLLGAVLAVTLLFARNGGGLAGMPASWAGIGYGSIYVFDRLNGSTGPRQPVKLAIVNRPDQRDIVYIIDESIAGSYLDINGPTGVRSGLEKPRPGLAIHNFGLASSISNCSMTTNINLRFGGTRVQYRYILATQPSIWSYAKKAGYQTVYLYGQTGGRNENYMTDAERVDIDASHYFDRVAPIDRDQQIAAMIGDYSRNGRRDFILVNKFGAHFPVHDSYPPSNSHYQPALPRNIAWISNDNSDANRKSVVGKADDWRLYRNSYRNTVTWTVGAFFEKLFDRVSLADMIIIYTSDHGQTFHERGTPGVATHCYPDPQVEEMVVPLVVIEAASKAPSGWRDASNRNHNRSSHFRIFPSLLKLMGYDPETIRQTYGDALDSPRSDPMTSAAQMYLHSIGDTKWVDVNPASVIRPPAGDIDNIAHRN